MTGFQFSDPQCMSWQHYYTHGRLQQGRKILVDVTKKSDAQFHSIQFLLFKIFQFQFRSNSRFGPGIELIPIPLELTPALTMTPWSVRFYVPNTNLFQRDSRPVLRVSSWDHTPATWRPPDCEIPVCRPCAYCFQIYSGRSHHSLAQTTTIVRQS